MFELAPGDCNLQKRGTKTIQVSAVFACMAFASMAQQGLRGKLDKLCICDARTFVAFGQSKLQLCPLQGRHLSSPFCEFWALRNSSCVPPNFVYGRRTKADANRCRWQGVVFFGEISGWIFATAVPGCCFLLMYQNAGALFGAGTFSCQTHLPQIQGPVAEASPAITRTPATSANFSVSHL